MIPMHPLIEYRAMVTAVRLIRNAIRERGMRLADIPTEDIRQAARVLLSEENLEVAQPIINQAWNELKMSHEGRIPYDAR